MKAKVINIKGQDVGSIELSKEVFGAEYNEALIHQVIVATQNNARQGTKSTLTRTEVQGGGRKPWRQKGTGKARQGSIRAPQWIKGGIVFAPKPRDFSQKINKQMKKGAFVSAISTCFAEKNLIVLDALNVKDSKTANMAEILKNIGVDKKAILVTAGVQDDVVRSSLNLKSIKTTTADVLSTLDIVKYVKVVLTKDAVEKIEEAYAK